MNLNTKFHRGSLIVSIYCSRLKYDLPWILASHGDKKPLIPTIIFLQSSNLFYLFYEFKSMTIFSNNDTMMQSRFIALSLAHKHLLDGLDLFSVANDFVSLHDVYKYFWKFVKTDI